MDRSAESGSQSEFEREFENVFGIAPRKGIYSHLGTSNVGYPFDIPDEMAALLQFQTVEKAHLDEITSAARIAIRGHLNKYGGIEPVYSYENISKVIEKVCSYASLDLTWDDVYSSIAKELQIPLFQKKWLTNIARLLPNDSQIFEILPYLITCYIITAPQNRIDPYDDPPQSFSSGWRDIFQEYIQTRENTEESAKETAYNQSHSITSICSKFTLPVKGRTERFFCIEDDCIQAKGSRRGRPNKEGSPNKVSQRTWKKNHIMCLEYYRCFLALCRACAEAEIPGLNITLSMALFTSIWDFGDFPIGGYHYGNYVLIQMSKDDVESDCLMSLILDFDCHEDLDTLNLQSMIKTNVKLLIGQEDISGKKKYRKRIDKDIDNEFNMYGELL